MSLKTLIASIGAFFAGLFKSTKKAFEQLPPDQQDAIIKGVNISQLIKEGYKMGEALLIQTVADKTGLSVDVSKAVIEHALKSWGINEPSIQKGLDSLADAIQDGLTDDGWNGLWETVAKSAASWLGTGKISWVTLGLGVIEFAYQKIIKGIK